MEIAPLELAQLYAAAWNESDALKRLDLLRSCCENDVRFLQENIEIEGVDALHDLIGEFWSNVPDGTQVEVIITSDVQEHHGYGRGSFVWRWPDADHTGTDFVERGPNGKMKTIVVFMDGQSADS